MPKSKTRKNHSSKVKSRNERIENQKKQVNKLKREWINNLIKKEQEKGSFENTKSITDLEDNLPQLDGPII